MWEDGVTNSEALRHLQHSETQSQLNARRAQVAESTAQQQGQLRKQQEQHKDIYSN